MGRRWAQGYKIICDKPIEAFTPQKSEVAQLKWLDHNEVIAAIKSRDPKYPLSAQAWLEMFDLH